MNGEPRHSGLDPHYPRLQNEIDEKDDPGREHSPHRKKQELGASAPTRAAGFMFSQGGEACKRIPDADAATTT